MTLARALGGGRGVFLASAAVTLLFWLVLPPALATAESADYRDFYEPVGHALAEAGRLVTPDGRPAVRYPPGFPALLASLELGARASGTPRQLWIGGMIVVATAASAAALFRSASWLWGPPAAWAVALLWMTYPALLWLTKEPMPEIPFLALLFAGCASLARGLAGAPVHPARAGLAGLLVGAAILVRPLGLPVPIALALLLLGRRRAPGESRWSAPLALSLGTALVLLPWQLWLWSHAAGWPILSTGGAPSIVDGLTYVVRETSHRSAPWAPEAARAVMAYCLERSAEIDGPGAAARVLLGAALESPGGVVLLAVMKATWSWYATDTGRQMGALLAMQSAYLGLALAGGFGCWRAGGRWRALCLTVALLVAGFWGMTMLVLSILRYMVPAMGLLFLLAPGVAIGRARAQASFA